MAAEVVEQRTLVLLHSGTYQRLLNKYSWEHRDLLGSARRLVFDSEGSGILVDEGGIGIEACIGFKSIEPNLIDMHMCKFFVC